MELVLRAEENVMQEGELDIEETLSNTEVETPTGEPVKMPLISSVRVPPCKSVIVPVQVQGDSTGIIMPEPCRRNNEPEVSQSLLILSETGIARLIVSNKTQTMKRGMVVGTALSADVVDPSMPIELSQDPQEDVVQVQVNKIGSSTIWSAQKVEWRAARLTEMLGRDTNLQPDETNQLEALGEHHHAFALEERERGETDLIQLSINTGDSHPI